MSNPFKCPKVSLSNGPGWIISEKGSFQRFHGSSGQIDGQMDIFPVPVYWIQLWIIFGDECDKRFIANVRVLMRVAEWLRCSIFMELGALIDFLWE